jgi:hypothetical protein
MAAVERELIRSKDALALLFAPPFDKTQIDPSGAPSRPSSHRVAERLGENAASAGGVSAAKSAHRDTDLNGTAMRGQVQEPPLIAAVHLIRRAPAVQPASEAVYVLLPNGLPGVGVLKASGARGCASRLRPGY